jgi:hypothetical protein
VNETLTRLWPGRLQDNALVAAPDCIRSIYCRIVRLARKNGSPNLSSSHSITRSIPHCLLPTEQTAACRSSNIVRTGLDRLRCDRGRSRIVGRCGRRGWCRSGWCARSRRRRSGLGRACVMRGRCFASTAGGAARGGIAATRAAAAATASAMAPAGKGVIGANCETQCQHGHAQSDFTIHHQFSIQGQKCQNKLGCSTAIQIALHCGVRWTVRHSMAARMPRYSSALHLS